MEEIISSLIVNAKNNLNASKLLFENRLYSESIFMLQQSIEKANKAIALMSNLISITDLYNIKHNQLKILRKTLNNLNLNSNDKVFDAVFAHIHPTESLVDEKEDIIKTISNLSLNELYNLSDERINQLLNKLDDSLTSFPEIFKTKENRDLILQKALENSNLTNESIQQIKQLMSDDSGYKFNPDEIVIINAYIIFTLLGLLTCPHAEQSRYPTFDEFGKNVICPTSVYNENYKLILYYKRIIQTAEIGIEILVKTNEVE